VLRGVDDVRLIGFLEPVHVGDVVEQVGVERALCQCQVGLNVVVDLDQANLVALFFQLGHDGQLEHIVVVAGGGTKHQVLLVRVSVCCGPAQRHGGSECTHQESATNIHESGPCIRRDQQKEVQRLSRRCAMALPPNWMICTSTMSNATVSSMTSVWKR